MADFGPDDFQARLNVSRETLERVERYRQMLVAASAHTNLVGPSALESFWLRHAFDSAQLLSHAPDAKRWLDLGSGAGFPAIILAILLCDTAGAEVHMVDSVGKKTRFLQDVVTALGLPARVHNGRAEDLALPRFDVITARALAPMPRLLGYIAPHIAPETTVLLLKGQDVGSELTEASKSWIFNHTLHPSLSDPSGRIVTLSGLKRRHTQRGS
jgi:16S rRNA (guanine527-N7)-methyltransferase